MFKNEQDELTEVIAKNVTTDQTLINFRSKYTLVEAP